MSRRDLTVWALIGPAGAGKTALAGILADRGAAIVEGDRLGHIVLTRPAVQAALARAFGAGVVVGGTVDRKVLGGLVFSDPAALAILNEITHAPLADLAREKIAELDRAGQVKLAVFEAAIYFLLPSPPVVDLVVAVVAPLEIRVARLMAGTRGLTEAAARGRIAAQLDLNAHWLRADETIINRGTLADLKMAAQELLVSNGFGNEAGL